MNAFRTFDSSVNVYARVLPRASTSRVCPRPFGYASRYLFWLFMSSPRKPFKGYGRYVDLIWTDYTFNSFVTAFAPVRVLPRTAGFDQPGLFAPVRLRLTLFVLAVHVVPA